MKKISTILFSITFISCSLIACKDNADQNKREEKLAYVEKDTANYTLIKYIDSVKNFGTVKKGTQVKLKYTFQNVGVNPLYVINVQPSCGCTVADFTKGAILPGKIGEINASFDSNHGSTGSVRKSLIVTTNTTNDPNFVLAFIGNVN
ncbi:DUF1573 domain-containing protein [Rhizosphaericola mali]|nr:DUF1573 domain-containing protein [Rhizosphaericola mali]